MTPPHYKLAVRLDMDQPARDPGDVYVGILIGLTTLLFAYLGMSGLWDCAHGSKNPGADPLLCTVTLALVPFGLHLTRRLLLPARPDDRLLPQPVLLVLSIGLLGAALWFSGIDWVPVRFTVIAFGLGISGVIFWWQRRKVAPPP